MSTYLFKKFLFSVFLLCSLSGCANLNSEHTPGSSFKSVNSVGDLSKKQKKNLIDDLTSANNFHQSKQYNEAHDIYESILVDQENMLANIYALWGIIALKVDRDNPDYDRAIANVSLDVMEERINKIEHYVLAHEARLLKYSAEFMIKADLSKDEVIEENKTLITEIAQRDEAIKRLRDLSLGQ